jgi:hypothetical protein
MKIFTVVIIIILFVLNILQVVINYPYYSRVVSDTYDNIMHKDVFLSSFDNADLPSGCELNEKFVYSGLFFDADAASDFNDDGRMASVLPYASGQNCSLLNQALSGAEQGPFFIDTINTDGAIPAFIVAKPGDKINLIPIDGGFMHIAVNNVVLKNDADQIYTIHFNHVRDIQFDLSQTDNILPDGMYLTIADNFDGRLNAGNFNLVLNKNIQGVILR